MTRVRVATRASELALAQARLVAARQQERARAEAIVEEQKLRFDA